MILLLKTDLTAKRFKNHRQEKKKSLRVPAKELIKKSKCWIKPSYHKGLFKLEG